MERPRQGTLFFPTSPATSPAQYPASLQLVRGRGRLCNLSRRRPVDAG
jgi:hypothetical protein